MSLPTQSSPLVSIVIPVYNGSNYLGEAIDSALNQIYENIEIIVVNDGSDDSGETQKIIDSYGNRISGYYKKNGGVASALNYAIKVMKGDYFSWLSHDDLYPSAKIKLQIEAINCYGDCNVVVYGDFLQFQDDISNGIEINIPPVPPHKFRYFLTTKGSLHGCTLLIPKKCFAVCGQFDEDLKNVQDYDMWFRIAHDFTFIHVPEILVYGRQHALQGGVVTRHISRIEGNKLLASFMNKLKKEEVLVEGNNSLSYGYADASRKLKARGYNDAAKRAAILSIKSCGKGELKNDLLAMIQLFKQLKSH